VAHPTLTFERLFAFLMLGHGQAATAVVRGHTTRDSGVAGPTDQHRDSRTECGATTFPARKI
jgi:hypothetical protein